MEKDHSLCLKIDFEKNSKHPERIFKTMSRLIESIEDLQEKLSFSLSTSIKRDLLLKEIETGSLLTWLTPKTEYSNDDSEIKIDPDNDEKINKFLKGGIEKVIDFSSSRKKINSIEEVTVLQEEIHSLAEDADIKNLPAYSKISEKDLMEVLLKNNDASNHLSSNDDIFFIINGTYKKYNKNFSISKESIENILTKDIVEKNELLEIRIKKPDYIGNSMWEFVYREKIIEATLLHEEWLKDFRDRNITLKPGDSLQALVKITTLYNHNSEEIKTTYAILEVLKIIKQPFPTINGELKLETNEK